MNGEELNAFTNILLKLDKRLDYVEEKMVEPENGIEQSEQDVKSEFDRGEILERLTLIEKRLSNLESCECAKRLARLEARFNTMETTSSQNLSHSYASTGQLHPTGHSHPNNEPHASHNLAAEKRTSVTGHKKVDRRDTFPFSSPFTKVEKDTPTIVGPDQEKDHKNTGVVSSLMNTMNTLNNPFKEKLKTKGSKPLKGESDSEADHHEVPIVFVPGVKSSILIDKNNNGKAWIDGKMLLSNAEASPLALPLSFDENGVQDKDDLIPAGVFHHLSVVGGFKIPIYGPGLKHLRKTNHQVHEFSYDWRRSNNESVDKLENYIEQIVIRSGSKVQILCHSMGCMLGMVVMKRRPDLIKSAVFLAPPFKLGCPLFLLKHRDGHPMGLNKKLLASRVQFSWLSTYCAYPLDGSGITDVNNLQLKFDYYNVQTWIDEKWGLFHPDHPESIVNTPEYDTYVNFLTIALEDGKKFAMQLQAEVDIEYPPIAIVAGMGYDTKIAVMKEGPKSIRGLDSETPLKTKDGDDLLPISYTLLDPRIPHKRYTSKKAHAFLLQDIPVLNQAMQDIRVSTGAAGERFNFEIHEEEEEFDDAASIDNVDFSDNTLSLRDFESGF